MTKETLFTLLALKLGAPRTAPIGTGKAGVVSQKSRYDFLCEFISLAASNGFYISNESEFTGLLADYTQWYNANVPIEHTVST